MLERWRELDWLRRGMVSALAVMMAGFALANFFASVRKGVEYQGVLFLLKREGETCRYTGKVRGRSAEFTVRPGGIVEYRWGDEFYGPCQVEKLPSAGGQAAGLPGVEIRRGEEVLFRGGYHDGVSFMLIPEGGGDETDWFWTPEIQWSTGTIAYKDGRELTERDLHEPSLTTLAGLVLAPRLVHRGSLPYYLLATLAALFDMFQICCSDRVFRHSARWYVKNPEAAEPSEEYMVGERLSWGIVTIMTIILYCVGLITID